MSAFVEPVSPATPPAPPTERHTAPGAAVPSPTGSLPQTPKAMGPFFWLAANAPWLAAALRSPATWVAARVSPMIRGTTRLNAARIYGYQLPADQQMRFTRAVVASFYDFVLDVGRSSRDTRQGLLQRIERLDGKESYLRARQAKKGAVLVTAHMGSFEVGLAVLSDAEKPGAVQVVFKRDTSGPFETMRARMRAVLGIKEAPIDDGLVTWMDLRDALLNDGVVVMQADRAMPAQRSEVVPFLHGTLRIPTGAVRLARMTGSPIIPVYTVRQPSGKFVVHLHPPIEPGAWGIGPGDPAVRAIARSIESMVRAHPEQWLALWPAFEEDARA